MSYRVVVIGAGFGGIDMAIALKQAGIDDFVVLDRARNTSNWPDHTFRYRSRVRRFDLAAYQVMTQSQDTATGGAS